MSEINTVKNQNSTIKVQEIQEPIEADFSEILQKTRNNSRKELLNYLVSLEILKYSSFDDVYFVESNGVLYFISEDSN